MQEKPFHKQIKSFVRREGRMTISQKEALADLWPSFGLEVEDGVLDLDKVFSKPKQVVLEIGFGMGQSLLEMAKHSPEVAFIGIEVHRPGVGALLAAMERDSISGCCLYIM